MSSGDRSPNRPVKGAWMLAALLSVHKVLKLEPAIVFR